MIAACRKAKVKLMIAYRLHFEGLNLAAIDIARSGQRDISYLEAGSMTRARIIARTRVARRAGA